MVSYSCTVWGWADDLSTSLAPKCKKLSFRMRDEELMICTGLLGKEFSHLVLRKNLGPKETTKYLQAILAIWLETPALNHKDWPELDSVIVWYSWTQLAPCNCFFIGVYQESLCHSSPFCHSTDVCTKAFSSSRKLLSAIHALAFLNSTVQVYGQTFPQLPYVCK